jgi:hypothetical protein
VLPAKFRFILAKQFQRRFLEIDQSKTICYSRIVYIGDSLGHVTNHMLVVDLYQRDCVNLNQSTDLEPRREAIVLSQVGADWSRDLNYLQYKQYASSK